MVGSGELPDEVEPGRAGLWLGILVYRWMSLAWMVLLAATTASFRNALAAWLILAAVAAWNIWWTLSRAWLRPGMRWADLGLSAVLLLLSGVVQVHGGVAADDPFFATAYPVSSVMTVGAGEGILGGLVAAFVLAIGLTASRPLNGAPLPSLSTGQIAGLANGIVYYLSAGAAVGLVSRVLTTSGKALSLAREEALRERERAARIGERESIGRQLHDSVLQTLAIVSKRGKELSMAPQVPGPEMRRLADMASEQETALRELLQHEPEEPPHGYVALRGVLQAAAFGMAGIPVSVSTVDPAWVRAECSGELQAAVHQALDNVERHAEAGRAIVFGERDGTEIVVSVRDDGMGFDFDEKLLRREGRMGVLGSMKGRIEELGGTMTIHSQPGKGTEVEFRLPIGDEVG